MTYEVRQSGLQTWNIALNRGTLGQKCLEKSLSIRLFSMKSCKLEGEKEKGTWRDHLAQTPRLWCARPPNSQSAAWATWVPGKARWVGCLCFQDQGTPCQLLRVLSSNLRSQMSSEMVCSSVLIRWSLLINDDGERYRIVAGMRERNKGTGWHEARTCACVPFTLPHDEPAYAFSLWADQEAQWISRAASCKCDYLVA